MSQWQRAAGAQTTATGAVVFQIHRVGAIFYTAAKIACSVTACCVCRAKNFCWISDPIIFRRNTTGSVLPSLRQSLHASLQVDVTIYTGATKDNAAASSWKFISRYKPIVRRSLFRLAPAQVPKQRSLPWLVICFSRAVKHDPIRRNSVLHLGRHPATRPVRWFAIVAYVQIGLISNPQGFLMEVLLEEIISQEAVLLSIRCGVASNVRDRWRSALRRARHGLSSHRDIDRNRGDR